MKKLLSLVIASCFLIFAGACFTPALYDKPAEETRHSTEEISSFLITQDGKNLIVVGKAHHYIFSANETLKFILGWSEKQRVKATFNEFTIRSDQSMYGTYTLTVADNLNAPLKKQLLSIGFVEDKKQKTLIHQASISGVRYLADKFELPATMRLNQRYTIQITEFHPSVSGTVERILLTPLAIAADGLLIMGAIPVLLFSGIADGF